MKKIPRTVPEGAKKLTPMEMNSLHLSAGHSQVSGGNKKFARIKHGD